MWRCGGGAGCLEMMGEFGGESMLGDCFIEDLRFDLSGKLIFHDNLEILVKIRNGTICWKKSEGSLG